MEVCTPTTKCHLRELFSSYMTTFAGALRFQGSTNKNPVRLDADWGPYKFLGWNTEFFFFLLHIRIPFPIAQIPASNKSGYHPPSSPASASSVWLTPISPLRKVSKFLFIFISSSFQLLPYILYATGYVKEEKEENEREAKHKRKKKKKKRRTMLEKRL